RQLLQMIADQKAPRALVTAITRETSGNPFFIREVLLHLIEAGTLVKEEGRWDASGAVGGVRLPRPGGQGAGGRPRRPGGAAGGRRGGWRRWRPYSRRWCASTSRRRWRGSGRRRGSMRWTKCWRRSC